ncbi:hypothetical protein HNQ91_002990 [Filimonas zeae]|uniref:Uncharacterized protein n=1 Tax=Filimonas zeae TaxID=1737353 RepID=A0A917J1Q6_9BACT|nr:hypothetical protein [Filimonas zeae]MDR6339925.1 hypothetical protein [Filimonas zeae]GGH70320.1 hypothetical protein GCM10011379_28470 [Filimonas zeae]
MMRKKQHIFRLSITILILLFIITSAFAQLPTGYRLVKGESPIGRDDFYTNGRIKIFHDVIQEFGDGGAANWIKSVYQGFTIIKTKDGLVVGIGNQNGTNMYMVFKGHTYYTATSKDDSNEFSEISKYILRKVRELGTSFLE